MTSAAARFEVRALVNGEGWVIIDHGDGATIIGPYRTKARARARAAEFEADPSKVPPWDRLEDSKGADND